MQDYIFIYMLFAVVTYVVLLLCSVVGFTKRRAICTTMLFIVVTSLIAANRPFEAADTSMYRLVYANSVRIVQNVKIERFLDVFANRSYYSIEFSYIVFMSIFRRLFESPKVFFMISGLLSNTLTVYGLVLVCQYIYDINPDDREDRDYLLQRQLVPIFCLYTLYCGILYTSVAIRSGLAIGIGLVAVGNLLLNKRRTISIVLLIVSFMLHTIAISFAIIFLFLKFVPAKFKESSLAFFWLLALVGYFGNISKYTTQTFINLLLKIFSLLHINAFSSYIANMDYTVQLREGYVLFFVGLFLILAYIKNEKIDRLCLVVIIGLYLYTFAYPVHAMSRMVDIFTIFLIPIICYCEANSFNRNKTYIIRFGSILLLVPQYIMIFGRTIYG